MVSLRRLVGYGTMLVSMGYALASGPMASAEEVEKPAEVETQKDYSYLTRTNKRLGVQAGTLRDLETEMEGYSVGLTYVRNFRNPRDKNMGEKFGLAFRHLDTRIEGYTTSNGTEIEGDWHRVYRQMQRQTDGSGGNDLEHPYEVFGYNGDVTLNSLVLSVTPIFRFTQNVELRWEGGGGRTSYNLMLENGLVHQESVWHGVVGVGVGWFPQRNVELFGAYGSFVSFPPFDNEPQGYAPQLRDSRVARDNISYIVMGASVVFDIGGKNGTE